MQEKEIQHLMEVKEIVKAEPASASELAMYHRGLADGRTEQQTQRAGAIPPHEIQRRAQIKSDEERKHFHQKQMEIRKELFIKVAIKLLPESDIEASYKDIMQKARGFTEKVLRAAEEFIEDKNPKPALYQKWNSRLQIYESICKEQFDAETQFLRRDCSQRED